MYNCHLLGAYNFQTNFSCQEKGVEKRVAGAAIVRTCFGGRGPVRDHAPGGMGVNADHVGWAIKKL